MENNTKASVNHAVRYDHFGHADVLYIAELPIPKPDGGEVLVKMKTAGINPGEASIREGWLQQMFPSTFPSGQGTDFAGIVETVGSGVSKFKTGDEVIGFSNERSSQAEYIVIKEDQLVIRPANVSWEEAGGLFVAGTTAYGAVEAVALKDGDLVVVSAAAGGVGSLVVQLAKHKGATVLGFASESNHEWLKKHNIVPVDYNGNAKENLAAALNGRTVDAFIDTAGKVYVQMAIELGVPAGRIDTIIDFEAAGKYKVKTDGSSAAGTAKVLGELAQMVSDGKLEITIANTYPLANVKEAFLELEKKHTRGKIILTA